MAAPVVQVARWVGVRLRLLREGRGWTVHDDAPRAGRTTAEGERLAQGEEVATAAYRAVLQLFGFTPHAMAFLGQAGQQGGTR